MNPSNKFYSTHHMTTESTTSAPPTSKPHQPLQPRTPKKAESPSASAPVEQLPLPDPPVVDHHITRSQTLPRGGVKALEEVTKLEHSHSLSETKRHSLSSQSHSLPNLHHHAHTLTAKDMEYATERETAKQEALEKEKTMTEDQIAKRSEHRKKVEDEIKSTEKSYVTSLNALFSTFVVPLQKKAADAHIVTSEQLEALISNLETLHKFHNAFVLDLEKTDECAAVILRYGDFFKLYKRYLNGYTACLNAFTELRTNTKFQTFLSEVRASLVKHGTLDLMSYMIMPVQRVPRYVLLLKELSKYTSPTSTDWISIEEALLKIKDVTTDINEAKRQMEQMSRLMEVQNRIQGEFGNLVVPHRRLLREGTMQEMAANRLFGSLKPTPRVFFLFSDILLWTTDSYRFKGYLQLVTAALEDDKKSGSNMFSLTTSKLHITIACKDATEKESWMADIRGIVEQSKLARAQQMQVRKMQKTRRTGADHNHAARSKLHEKLVDGLQKVEIESHDDDPDDDKTDEQKELEAKHEKRLKGTESLQKDLEKIMHKSESHLETDPESSTSGSSSPGGSSSSGGSSTFKARTLQRRGPTKSPTLTKKDLIDDHSHHHLRPSVLIGEGGDLCNCKETVKDGVEKPPCRIHPHI